jgi:hypothetical protein
VQTLGVGLDARQLVLDRSERDCVEAVLEEQCRVVSVTGLVAAGALELRLGARAASHPGTDELARLFAEQRGGERFDRADTLVAGAVLSALAGRQLRAARTRGCGGQSGMYDRRRKRRCHLIG